MQSARPCEPAAAQSCRGCRGGAALAPLSYVRSSPSRSSHPPGQNARRHTVETVHDPAVIIYQFAGAEVGMGPGRGLSTVPSDLVTLTHAPAGRPSRNGRVRTVTLSPGRSAFALIPARISALGPSASMPHNVSVPWSPRTTTKSQECGLVYSNSFTVPSSVTTFSGSNIAPE